MEGRARKRINPSKRKMRNGEWGMRNIPPAPSLPRKGGGGEREGIQNARIEFRVPGSGFRVKGFIGSDQGWGLAIE
jgi:hypothetical protein